MSAGGGSRHRDKGQSSAELAVLLPVIMFLILAVIQIGLVARDYVVIHHAANEAARRSALDPTATVARSAAVGSSPVLQRDRLEVGLGGDAHQGGLLTVRVRYRSATAVPVVGALIGDVSMSAEAVVRVE